MLHSPPCIHSTTYWREHLRHEHLPYISLYWTHKLINSISVERPNPYGRLLVILLLLLSVGRDNHRHDYKHQYPLSLPPRERQTYHGPTHRRRLSIKAGDQKTCRGLKNLTVFGVWVLMVIITQGDGHGQGGRLPAQITSECCSAKLISYYHAHQCVAVSARIMNVIKRILIEGIKLFYP